MDNKYIYDSKTIEESKDISPEKVESIVKELNSVKKSMNHEKYLKLVLDEAKKLRVKGMLNFFYDILLDLDSRVLKGVNPHDIYALKNTIGTMFYYQSSYDLALKYYMEGLDYISIHDGIKRGSIYNNLGEIYREIKEYEHALLYYSWAKELFQEEGMEFHYSVVSMNMALILIKEEKYDGALEYVENTLAILDKGNYNVNYGDALSVKGRIYFKMGRVFEAKKIYEKAQTILEESENTYYLLKHLLNMGEMYSFEEKFSECLDVYERGLDIAKKLKNNRIASVIERRVSEVYEYMGDYKSALMHHKAFNDYKSRYLEQNLKSRIKGMNKEYEKNHSKIEFDSRDLENQLLKQKSLELKSMNVSLINEIAIRERSHVKLKETNERLMKISMLDELTQIPNRRSFVDKMLAIGKDRSIINIGLIMVDIDHFKKFNDFYGHNEGDQALVEVARVLNKVANRFNGFVARHGGEEFVLIFCNVNINSLSSILQGVKDEIIDLSIPHENGSVNGILTVSQGAFIAKNGMISVEEILEKADEALYTAKGNGRNNYVINNER